MDASARAYGDGGSAQGYAANVEGRSPEPGGTVVELFGHEACADAALIEECCPDCQLEANLRRWTG